MFRRFVIAIATVIAVGILAGDAEAATITVGTTADTSASQCTLRDAITASNANSATGACSAGSGPSDVIDLRSLTGTITLGSALPAIGAPQSSIDIQGPGPAALTVSGANSFGVFYVAAGPASISGLRIADGKCTFGCGIRSDGDLILDDVAVEQNVATVVGGTNSFPQAGGISNSETMTVTNSTVSGNSAVASGATSQNAPAGGGFFNYSGATLTIDRSTVSGNSATASAGAGGTTNINGGGIDNLGNLNVLRSTLTGNTAAASGSTTFNSASGGAIANSNSAAVHVVIDRSTISGNTVTATGAGATNNPQGGGFNALGGIGSLAVTSSTISGNGALIGANLVVTSVGTFKSTIISGPQGGGQNCSGSGGTSQGFNLTDGTGCGFSQATDKLNANPQLDPSGPANNGGPTKTIALMPGSPAIDAGVSSAGETVDQRGGLRPYDVPDVANAAGSDGTDVGAYEVEDTTPPETTITEGPADGSTINDRSPAFGFSSNEPAATFECRFDGGAFAACDSPAAPPAPLGDGAHSFEVRASDAANNVDATPATRTFTVDTSSSTPTVDTTPPETTLTKAPKARIKTKKKRKTVSISFSSEAGATFQCRLDDGAFAACKSPMNYSLKKGKHVIEVRATDSAGNTDATPATTTVTIKRKKPKKHRHAHH